MAKVFVVGLDIGDKVRVFAVGLDIDDTERVFLRADEGGFETYTDILGDLLVGMRLCHVLRQEQDNLYLSEANVISDAGQWYVLPVFDLVGAPV
jgi:hypothetical protein